MEIILVVSACFFGLIGAIIHRSVWGFVWWVMIGIMLPVIAFVALIFSVVSQGTPQ